MPETRSQEATAGILVTRQEFIREEVEHDPDSVVEKPLTLWEKLYNQPLLRKAVILVVLALIWQIYSIQLNNPLMLPKFSDTVTALWSSLVDGNLVAQIGYSIRILLTGYAIGIGLAALLVMFAMSSRIGNDFLETMTSMFNPLPAIALLPLALLWFGLGDSSLIFVLIHSVLWSVSLNTHTGFQSVSPTLRMVGHNYGLRGFGYVAKILIPAAFPSILTGLKIGWAFAWRTLIAAELVFGVSSGAGGLGWFIYENKNELNIAHVFAGLFTVIMIGLAVENIIFRNVEARTVRKWGMQN